MARIDITHYTKLLFNEETGKERYGLAQKEAEKIFNENSSDECWQIAIECYECKPYYIQMLGVYILGLIGNKKALNFLKNTVSRNSAWQIQEFLAMAFDNYCRKNGYENSLKTIDEWLNSKNENVRRAVIEGLRIWTKRPYFEDVPEKTIKFLSQYKSDESDYVRKSVGNALKDISKAYPDFVKKELSGWKPESKETMQVYKLASKLLQGL